MEHLGMTNRCSYAAITADHQVLRVLREARRSPGRPSDVGGAQGGAATEATEKWGMHHQFLAIFLGKNDYQQQ